MKIAIQDVFLNDVHYLKELHELQNALPFLSERMKIGKVEKLLSNFYNK